MENIKFLQLIRYLRNNEDMKAKELLQLLFQDVQNAKEKNHYIKTALWSIYRTLAIKFEHFGDKEINLINPESYLCWPAMNTIFLHGIKDILRGRDLVIIGSSEEILDVKRDRFKRLNDPAFFGVNATYLKFDLDYMLCTYSSEAISALANGNCKHIIQFRIINHQNLAPRIWWAPLEKFEGALETNFDNTIPIFRSSKNIIFPALHLAAYMRPKSIVLTGFNLKDNKHFYDYDPEARTKYEHLKKISYKNPLVQHDHIYDNMSQEPGETGERKKFVIPFSNFDHLATLTKFRTILESMGILCFVTDPGSLVADSGFEIFGVS